MPSILAVIELSFDSAIRWGGLTLRWQTVGITVALFVALGVAALMAPDLGAQRPHFGRGRPEGGTGPPDLADGSDPRPRFPPAPVLSSTGEVVSSAGALRLDDMVLIVAGIVPGAAIGGRLVHALTFWDAYAVAPLRVLDPSIGSLSLLGAVIGGIASGVYVARLIGAPLWKWADAAAVPLLLAIGLGKMAQLLGGSGQGLPFDGPWAIAFVGGGPWVTANPEVPSHPAQVYEAIWMLAGIPLVLRAAGRRLRPARVSRYVTWADRAGEEGRLFIGAVAWLLLGRFVVGFTWRDEPVIGPFGTEQLLALAALIGILAWSRSRKASRVALT